MDEKELTALVQDLLRELDKPERHLHTITRDFYECGIDYAVIGSLAVRAHNYPIFGADIDFLVSRETFMRIEQYFIGHGYSYRPGSDRHLYYEYPGGRIPLDTYVEGEERDGFVLPDPRTSRIQMCKVWYASLPLLITLKIRAKDLGDVFEMIHENELGADFAANLEPDVREKFLEMVRGAESSVDEPQQPK